MADFLTELILAYQSMEEAGISFATYVIREYGGLGVLVGMFLESSIIPIPSELVLVTAGALGVTPLDAAIYGTIGSTLGAIVGYFIGLKGGRPLVDKIGPYLFVTKERIDHAEKKFNEWGKWTILFARLIPFIPFKVFSVTSGLLKYDFKNFVIFTFIGTIPRAFLLAWVGEKLLPYKSQVLLAVAALIALGVLYFLVKKYFFKKKEAPQKVKEKVAEKKKLNKKK